MIHRWCSSIIAARRLTLAADRRSCGAYLSTLRPSLLDTFMLVARRPDPPQSPTMPRPAVQLGVLRGQLPRQNATVIQGYVPFVITEGQDSYRLAQATAGKGVKPLV